MQQNKITFLKNMYLMLSEAQKNLLDPMVIISVKEPELLNEGTKKISNAMTLLNIMSESLLSKYMEEMEEEEKAKGIMNLFGEE